MQVQVLDLDGSIPRQRDVLAQFPGPVIPLAEWGPQIRLGCRFGQFASFERALTLAAGPAVTLFGSGDFHHVTLALLRRLTTPFNLLVLDKHPDWMRGIPFLHCGTWLNHALRLPLLQQVF